MAKKNYFKRVSRKRYQSKRFQNPFFKRKTTLPWKKIVTGVTVLVGILAVTGFSLGHQKLDIQSVEILGVEHIARSSLEAETLGYLNERAFGFFSRSNIFLLRTADLSDRLSESFTFSSISVSTQGTILYVSIKERTSNLIWKTGETQYIADLTGIIVRERVGETEDELPLFIDKNELAVSIGETVLTEKEVNGTLLFHEHLEAQSISFYDTIFDRLAGKWVSVSTSDGYSILFDPTGDIDSQAARLATVLATQVNDVTALDYIDLRFGDHVYFR